MGKIFVNYRRGDDPGFTTALYIQLEARFGKDRLFMDVEGHIKPGDDFVEVLGQQVAECDVLLAIIGPRWEGILVERGDDPDDFVLIEIEAALNQGKRVIPVLVGGAGFPRTENLPGRIKLMARKNAVAVRPERFMADAQGLIKALEEAFQAADAEQNARIEAERRAAELKHYKTEEAEASTWFGMADILEHASHHDYRSVVEWKDIKEKIRWGNAGENELRDYLTKYSDGLMQYYAHHALERLVWNRVSRSPSIVSLRAYLQEFPKGMHAVEAATELARLEKAEASRSDED